MLTTRLPSTIRIGRRHRQDLGDVVGLARSIHENGLLHPIVIRADNALVAGRRRLEAWRLAFGADIPIPVHVVALDAVTGEYDENVFREPLKPSELVSLMRELTPAIAAASRERQKELGRTRGGAPDPMAQRWATGSPDPRPWETGRTRDKVAGLLGVSHNTLAKAAAIVDAASADPERYEPLRLAMDRTGKVHGPHKRLTVMRMAAEIRAEPPPLPSRGPYRVIAVDPPWPFDADSEDPSERGTHPYPQMSYAQIEAFLARAIAEIGHADLAAWLWTTNYHLARALGILAALGLEVKTVLTWGKDQIGRGQYLREQTEHCIVAVRGKPVFQLAAESTLLLAPRRNHSEKPAAFYDLVERVCPAPRYACLFSHLQGARERWDQHSTESRDTPPASDGGRGGASGRLAPPRRAPAVEDLVAVGDIVTTSYGSGPYLVVRISGPHIGEHGGEPTWSLCLADPKAKPRRETGLPGVSSWINDIRAVDGRLIAYGRDEVFVEPSALAEGAREAVA